ncbi:unnamed protein product [Gongylonema pulchrum]|uniref:KH domain-containing protein n=1 Tax=Gongylonema pulchrum TaxID=637853 RepID=A0A183DN42_9BILA|nr:unnamed protein product [Gongylonema pulchrum]
MDRTGRRRRVYRATREDRFEAMIAADVGSAEPLGASVPFSSGRILRRLVHEMGDLEDYLASHPGRLRHTYGLLVNKINSTWGLICARANQEGNQRNTERARQRTGRRIVLEQKVPIPVRPNTKLVGRILGPRGLTVKQIEAQTDCSILIRGKGSIKDPNQEVWLRNQPGWEHLNEPLHVLITASDYSEARCVTKLAYGVHCIMTLLNDDNEELKRQQLIQHAVINGIYRPM